MVTPERLTPTKKPSSPASRQLDAKTASHLFPMAFFWPLERTLICTS